MAPLPYPIGSRCIYAHKMHGAIKFVLGTNKVIIVREHPRLSAMCEVQGLHGYKTWVRWVDLKLAENSAPVLYDLYKIGLKAVAVHVAQDKSHIVIDVPGLSGCELTRDETLGLLRTLNDVYVLDLLADT